MVNTQPAFKMAVRSGTVKSEITITVFKTGGQITIANDRIHYGKSTRHNGISHASAGRTVFSRCV